MNAAMLYGAEVIPLPSRAPARSPGSSDAVIADPAMRELYRVASRLAPTRTTVLLLGESGSGKEVVAEHIHRASPRASGPFVRLNCAALADTLLESELFGHERGAFTGADRRRGGYVEAAHGGTLLLDEIGELPLRVQAKLLRVLETRCVTRLGSTAEIPVDVRFVCATHRELPDAVQHGTFRQDLFFRIAAATLRIPPLRERPTEIMLLAERFAGGVGFTNDARAALLRHTWPGNVRELHHAVELAAILGDGRPIRVEHLPEHVRTPARSIVARSSVRETLCETERAAIVDALAHEHGNQTRAAVRLGMSRRSLVYKLGKYGLRTSDQFR